MSPDAGDVTRPQLNVNGIKARVPERRLECIGETGKRFVSRFDDTEAFCYVLFW
jgi:hypothetical protein